MKISFNHGITVMFGDSKSFNITFDKKHIKPYFFKSKSNKYVDNSKIIVVQILGLQFLYEDSNYNKIVHLYLDSEKTYDEYLQRNNIKVFKAICHEIVVNPNCKYLETNKDLLLNWGMKDNGKLVYYITVKKEWIIKNNLDDLLGERFPDLWMTDEEMSRNFHKFNYE